VHRALVLRILDDYGARHPEDAPRVALVRDFVRAHPDCLLRSCREGHVTASAWILSPDHRLVLLTHHRKLGRWLQLGGHADGEADPRRVALREAEEESGLTGFTTHDGDADLPLDVDVHPIPARGDEPAHLHYDLRYLLVAPAGREIRPSPESNELRWVARRDLEALTDEESVLRLERRARALLPIPRRGHIG
jgi:8-oxo-dGTP pyrophosphatase MutT (NUDIX family)